MLTKSSLKSYPILFLLAALALAGCEKKGKKELPDLHKKRPESPVVKRVEHYYSDSSNVELLLETQEYNKEGQKIRYVLYQAKDTLDHEEIYTPDEKGHPTKTVMKYLDGSSETQTHTYNKKGDAEKTEWQRSDGTKGRHEFKYDDHDSLVEWARYENGKYLVTQLWPNKYDKDDNVIESWYKETNNGHDTATQSHWQYDYDSLGRLTHRLTLSGPALQTAEEFYYDSLNDCIMIIEYGLDSTRSATYIAVKKTINTFTEYGELLTSQIMDADGNDIERIENEYDKYGHKVLSVITRTDESGKKVTEKHRWVYQYY
jgi:YD repeat-containing protein